MERIAQIIAEASGTDLTGVPSPAVWQALNLLAALLLTAVIVLTILRRRRRLANPVAANPLAAGRAPEPTPFSRGEWGRRMLDKDTHPEVTGGTIGSTVGVTVASTVGGTIGGANDPAWRLHTVAAHGYRTRPIMTRTQAHRLLMLERIVYGKGHGHRLLTPTALSQLLEPVATPSGTAERLTKAARALDGVTLGLPLVDAEGYLIAAIEVRGPRSLNPAIEEGERIKRTVLRRAGVPLVEIGPNDDEATLRATIEPLLIGDAPLAAG